jgi:hypothetical protein
MTPKKTQIACPLCHQPVVVNIEQLFDVTRDPGAKQRLLGNVSNFVLCQKCGYNGPIATPVVYHDNGKELLLTFFPPELNVPVNEQEKIMGPFINEVTNSLPSEKRKGYLLRPQNFLTYQSFIERILGADGITPEMIKAQQQRVSLVERLLGATTPETRTEIIKQDAALFDAAFFSIFERLMEGATSSGQEKYIQQMDEIQKQLLAETEYGRSISKQANEIQEAVKTLQAVGKNLDREKLLEIITAAPNDDRLGALVSLTRPGIDYLFFQALSEKIEKTKGEEKKRLEELREKLLNITRQIDQHTEAEVKRATDLLNSILTSEDIEKATLEHLAEINDNFVQVLNHALQEANSKNDESAMPKLQKIVGVLQQASAPPPELALLEELLSAPDEEALNKLIEQHAAEITPEFTSVVANILSQSEAREKGKLDKEEAKTLAKIEALYKAVLKFSMNKNM